MNTSQFPKLLRRVPKFITGLTLLAFATLVFMGIFDCANPIMQSQMSMDGSAHAMTDCIPGKNCGMDINTHIEIWQGMIMTNLPATFFSFFATLLMAAFVWGMCKIVITPEASPLTDRYLYYDRDHRESKLYNYFIHIFSRGILQPKLFA